ncbi:glycosyltransferase [Ancylobacter sp. A5.8]|uniref:rhamnan synthesis F family protein n=1 Tax=Ancylobacter gelatini TaxID=2919920 RepID=UPI001F4D9F00|nr:rhamnan synthesis F family protein [Ancylobacter gelatini]MCJ8142810.1 glycosyltransferase [Ancylobacter gelatini]
MLAGRAGELVALSARLLAGSPRFDREGYARAAGLEPDADPAEHYVTRGWREGLEPLFDVETHYLRPYLVAAGVALPPAVAWLEFEHMGAPLPFVEAHSHYLAGEVRASPLFDEAYYSGGVPRDLDAALHYVLVGERFGSRPSASFDPSYYLEANPDLHQVRPQSCLLLHYDRHGVAEGRRRQAIAEEMIFDPLPDDERPVILLICHEASRTGAPILGWNLIEQLSADHRVVSVLLRGGDLEPNFRAVAAASTTPLTWADWRPVEMRHLAERLVRHYRPIYAVANSIETQILVPALAREGVAVVALVHEFASYVRPREKLSNVFDWAHDVVFPAQLVAASSMETVAGLGERNGIHVLAQGRSQIPGLTGHRPVSSAGPLRPPGQENATVVLGAGMVQMRKGVDLFIEVAAVTRRLRPDLDLRFVWIGHGYDPETDLNYSTYLREQIRRSNLGDSFQLLDAVDDIEAIYRQADIFLLTSRLDPQPNVCIDTMTLGIPTVCFEGGAGTAEVLASDPATGGLVVPYLDTHAAAEAIWALVDQPERRAQLSEDLARLARGTYDMPSYAARIAEIGRRASHSLRCEDAVLLGAPGIIDPTLLFAPHDRRPPASEWAATAMLRWKLWNGIEASAKGGDVRRPFRRARAGFHPTVYAQAHPEACIDEARDPLAHWVEAGQPVGPWSRRVLLPRPRAGAAASTIALHGHFHYPELIDDFLYRLSCNDTTADLFITTDSPEKAAELAIALAGYRGRWDVRLCPNRGRDIGPFLTGLADILSAGTYEVVGHLHAKRSLGVDAAMGERWRGFLWENLVGGRYAMLDRAAQAFDEDETLGLVFAEDPHVVGWNDNRAAATDLARRMGMKDPLPAFFDFPLGTMFWARPRALQPLLDLALDWTDYPPEPLAGDGTLLHAIERLIPLVTAQAGFTVAGLRVPGTSW